MKTHYAAVSVKDCTKSRKGQTELYIKSVLLLKQNSDGTNPINLA